MKAIVVGPSRGLVEAFEQQGATAQRLDGVVTQERLESVGVGEADAIVLTDVGEASAIPVAHKLNPDVRVVIYAHDTMPDFVRAQVDLAVDPDLMGPDVVAEELASA